MKYQNEEPPFNKTGVFINAYLIKAQIYIYPPGTAKT